MFTAAYEGDVQAVVTWLDGGGGVDASQQISVEGTLVTTNGATLLVAATMGEQEAMVRMLLQRGASVNQGGRGGDGAAGRGEGGEGGCGQRQEEEGQGRALDCRSRSRRGCPVSQHMQARGSRGGAAC